MRRTALAALLLLLLAACTQTPYHTFNPTGDWRGTWNGGVADTNLRASLTATSSGWQGIFTSNNSSITALCSTPDDQPPNYLYCGAFTSSEILVWEGSVVGDSWSGVWTYVGSGGNRGGSFSLTRE